MIPALMTEVETAIQAWVTETRTLLATAERLAEYFGTDEEEHNVRCALDVARRQLEVLEDASRRARIAESWRGTPPPLRCSEPLARILSPILEVITGPVPEFVGLARKLLSEADAKAVIVPFGEFAGTFASYVVAPLWREYPSLAPEGWPL
jgi:hypothetical protein